MPSAVVAPLIRLAPPIAIALMAVFFVAAASRVGDPSLRRGTPTRDRRAHRQGALLARLRAERDTTTEPAERALLSVRISDVLVTEHLFELARPEIDRALRVAPDSSGVLVRAALVDHALGEDAEAGTLLRRAEAADPGDPEVARARAFVGRVTPPMPAAASRPE